jgi:ribonuclease G
MSKELVISANRHETRVAIIEDDQVVEVYHQRENEYSLAGSIHKGRVTRVLPGMQSAFVDIGLERDAFLYVSDFFEDNEEYDKIVTSVEEKVFKQLERPIPPPAAVMPPAMAEAEAPAESAAPMAVPVVGGAAPQATAPPVPDPRRDDGRRDDPRRGGDDRDRRGRRSRRRRGQRGGGRGLPDSKFYSPGARGGDEEPAPRNAPAVAPPPEAAPAPPGSAEDFLVLPGESLAKYTGPAEDELEAEEFAAEQAEQAGLTDEDATELAAEIEAEIGEPVDVIVVDLAPELEPPVETLSEIAAQPAAEPQPELAAAVEVVVEEVVAPVETGEPESAETAAPEEPGEDEGEEAEIAEDLDAAPDDAAEPAGELTEAAEAAEPIVEEEGPEPARIPTSLTATLREQGPRYLHRVSRRMRRRGGRDGREGREGNPEGREGRREGRGQDRPPQDRPPQDRPPQESTRSQAERAPEGETRTAAGPRPDPRNAPAPQAGARDKGGAPSISDLLREGQEIIVQIAKEPLGQKGARITSHIALPGRFLVYMPTVDHIGVSRKIPSDEERLRLKRVLQNNRTGISGGYIVRTAGEGRSEEELRADMMFLYNLWLDIRQKAERRPAPLLIHHDLDVVERVLRDQLTTAFKSVWVDNEESYESVLRFVQRFQPALVNRVKMYTRSTPIFDEFGITGELEKALRPKVWLKSGGYIVINQTEALVAIDVNTGKYVGKSNRLEDTIVRTNTDAIKEIVRQIRLRDLGGIIVVDFIDMDERKNRQKVMQALEEAMRADRAPYKILQFNDFGLVAITRKRVKQSLERTLCMPCPYCEAAGYVKSAQTVVGEILQEAQKIARAVEGKDVMLRVGPDVARLLKSNQNTYLQELEEILGRTVIVKSDAQLHVEKFDLA